MSWLSRSRRTSSSWLTGRPIHGHSVSSAQTRSGLSVMALVIFNSFPLPMLVPWSKNARGVHSSIPLKGERDPSSGSRSKLGLRFQHLNLVVSSHIDRIGFVTECEIVNVHGHLLLTDSLLRLQIEEQKEAVIGTAATEQPITLGVELQVFNKSLELVVRVFVRPRTLLPVEHLDARLAFQMVDVADLANAAGRQ